MSLINQALKKAQREQGAPPPVVIPSRHGLSDDEPGARSTYAERQTSYRALNRAVPVILILACLLAAGALFRVMFQAPPVAEPQATTPPAESSQVRIRLAEPAIPAPAPEPAAAAEIASATPAPPAPAPLAETNPEPASPAVSSTAARGSASQPTETAPSTPVASGQQIKIGTREDEPPPPPIPSRPLPDAEPNPKVLAFLEASRITGVKVAGPHSRLLMNNQVFKPGDTVHPDTGLRIKAIEPNEIIFVDEPGIRYRKQFQR